jgi:pyruvate/2-oxoglutarate dehydrogenase complex dihydrolipoamide acyltransferase (E2) component
MIQIRMPEAGFSITEGTVVEWYKEVGEQVREGENVVCVETDKLTVDIPAERGGVLHEARCKSGDVVPVGAVMGIIREGEESIPADGETSVKKADEGRKGVVKSEATRRISPAAKATARAVGVDLSQILQGNGPLGRIVKQDVLDFIASGKPGAARRDAAAASEAGRRTNAPPEIEAWTAVPGPGERIEFTGWRKVIADRMVASKREIPHYTMSVEADVTDLSAVIGRVREEEGIKVTYLPFMMKALEVGIQAVPTVNAFCDGKGFSVLEDIHMGVAVDLGEKLLVPVIKHVRDKSIFQLIEELGSLIERTRSDRLEPRDVEGGTITLTNVGMFQIHSATSVILQPQVAIIYMGAAREVPGVDNGGIVIRRKMIFGATFDHRVVNGASGGRFLMKVKQCLEEVGTLAMSLR